MFLGAIRCSLWNQNKGLHDSYLYYKQFLDFVLKNVVQVKSVISTTLPRFLTKMDTALRNLQTALNCDWREVSIKYVQLEYYLRNLQRTWILYQHYQSSIPLRTSDFLSRRIKDVLLQPSNELLELMLKLASKQQSADSLKYLENLKFKKAPLWETKDEEFFK